MAVQFLNPFDQARKFQLPEESKAAGDTRKLQAAMGMLGPEYDLKRRNELAKQSMVGRQKSILEAGKVFGKNQIRTDDPDKIRKLEMMRKAIQNLNAAKTATQNATRGFGLEVPPGTTGDTLNDPNKRIGSIESPAIRTEKAKTIVTEGSERKENRLRDIKKDGPGGQRILGKDTKKTVIKGQDPGRKFTLPGSPPANIAPPITPAKLKSDKPEGKPGTIKQVRDNETGEIMWVEVKPNGNYKQVAKPK